MPPRFDVDVQVGDIFNSTADILVVPCSIAGTVTAGIEASLRYSRLPPPNFMLLLGEARFIPLSSRRPWRALCFAASVDRSGATIETIESIGAQLGEYMARNRHLRSAAVPLLGAGAGGLDYLEAVAALVSGFSRTAQDGALLKIHVLDDDVFARVRDLVKRPPHPPLEHPVPASQPIESVEPPRNPRTAVFISYSHRDRKWMERLQVHLRPLERDHAIAIWDDTKIRPGTDWRSEIRNAISSARVAILLVSADFLASDFIAKDELPPLLWAAKEDGALILPVVVSPCRFVRTESLSAFQAVNDPERPLNAIKGANRERVLSRVADEVDAAFQTSKP